MARRKKSYNIWIAYSDLFTNLSTFLFISAFGMFAAIGSGMVGPMGLGSDKSCSAPRQAEQTLLRPPDGSRQPPSLLTKVGQAAGPSDPCRRYYQVERARYRNQHASLMHLRADDRALTEGEIYSRICQPIWLLISRRDFREHGGSVTFRGIVPALDEEPVEPYCTGAGQPPRFNDWGIPAGRSIPDVVAVCTDGEDGASYCKPVLECLARAARDRPSRCQRLVAILEWHRRAAHACDEQLVREQARTIFRICQGAPAADSFQDQLYADESIYVEEARFADTRDVLWEQVAYGVHTRTGRRPATRRNGPGNNVPLDRVSQGSIAVEVAYSR